MATTNQYQREIDKIIDFLEHDTDDSGVLYKVQQHLDKLAQRYQDNESLGTERYKLYQAQAMLSYRSGDSVRANQFIQEATSTRGHSYELAEQLLAHLNNDFTPKPIIKWIVLMALPIPLLVLVALAQLIVHFVFSTVSSDSVANVSSLGGMIVNIFSVLVGIVAVVMVLLIPIWAIQLLKARRYNSDHNYGLNKRTAVLIAVFLGFWYWLYTYERNKTKFWVGLCIGIFTAGYLAPIIWIWAIVDAANKPKEYYDQYPNYKP